MRAGTTVLMEERFIGESVKVIPKIDSEKVEQGCSRSVSVLRVQLTSLVTGPCSPAQQRAITRRLRHRTSSDII
jgi:hypothetical protein